MLHHLGVLPGETTGLQSRRHHLSGEQQNEHSRNAQSPDRYGTAEAWPAEASVGGTPAGAVESEGQEKEFIFVVKLTKLK